ncbi:Rv1733c family protein [Streptomyces sp. GS7]|uniref:Rv1733c family protein n=1 Tax=Streptomyces sp. GS7 TaxID=2692234 RepID=UPI003FA69B1E
MPLVKFRPPWRRGPLRRGTDVAQSWMALATGLLMAVAVPAAGVTAGQAVDAASQRQRAEWHRVTAVVTEEPSARIGADKGGGTGAGVYATVRWTAPDRRVRTGETLLPPGVRVGARTTVWLDRRGALVRDPGDPVNTVAMSIAAGTVAASTTGLLLFAVDRAGVRLLDHLRHAQWEKEWAELDAPGRHHRP